MKVTAEHYNLLKGYLKQAIAANNLTINQINETYSDKSQTRKVWDIYWVLMAQPYGKMIIRPIMDQYNDSHIDTALRKAWKEIESE